MLKIVFSLHENEPFRKAIVDRIAQVEKNDDQEFEKLKEQLADEECFELQLALRSRNPSEDEKRLLESAEKELILQACINITVHHGDFLYDN